MKTKLFVLTLCLLIPFSVFSQTTSPVISSPPSVGWGADTIYCITVSQLRAASKIFVEHDFLKTENVLLNERISLLERSGAAKDLIINSQQIQINALNEIIVRKDAMLMNSDAMIDVLKKQVVAEQKNRKQYTLYNIGIGMVIGGIVVAILK